MEKPENGLAVLYAFRIKDDELFLLHLANQSALPKANLRHLDPANNYLWPSAGPVTDWSAE